MGMMEERTWFNAECKETARLNFTPSSAIFTIILAIPTVDNVSRFDAIPSPF
jgi:hypothetical protein